MIELQTRPKQADFASVIGVSQQNVSALMAEGKLPTGGTWAELLIAYCHRLREVAAGRMSGELGGLDLVQERAGLAKAQREAQELKNAVARGEYAPIGILADVLGLASSAIVDRMDQFEGQVRKACPDLPQEVLLIVLRIMADARNEWIRSTSQLVNKEVEAMAQLDIDETAALDIRADADEEGDAA
ncbi:hypothetical protein [Comamonas suwonensis]|uniref:Uncharacterized protein n=1 Tax=Comamonas suwonensis TaxID=2606214 RepID=A0A843B4Z8_9BURK|nr:hypothetical protein [Comamonas suwonensis]MBI1626456.1 hypothetical protein [Comamonas suwonensis]